jgi:hypothetical protein
VSLNVLPPGEFVHFRLNTSDLARFLIPDFIFVCLFDTRTENVFSYYL